MVLRSRGTQRGRGVGATDRSRADPLPPWRTLAGVLIRDLAIPFHEADDLLWFFNVDSPDDAARWRRTESRVRRLYSVHRRTLAALYSMPPVAHELALYPGLHLDVLPLPLMLLTAKRTRVPVATLRQWCQAPTTPEARAGLIALRLTAMTAREEASIAWNEARGRLAKPPSGPDAAPTPRPRRVSPPSTPKAPKRGKARRGPPKAAP